MNRHEIESEYNVVNGIIRNPGKFEGEPVYTVHFWDISMDGGSNDVQYDGDTPVDFYTIDADDITEYPELAGHKRVAVWESDSGFVNSALDPDDLPEQEEDSGEDY